MKVSLVKKIMMVFAVAGFAALGTAQTAQTVMHQTVTMPGGVPGTPVMTGITTVSNGMQITWDGPSGYYQVFQKSNNLVSGPWLALGKATNLNRSATITKLYSNAFFRVAGPAPKYAGYKACLTCHLNVCRYETNTPHASAFNNLPGSQKANPSCLVCHTVGYGLPTGFVSESATPQLAGVQCENCHGPAANHAAAPDDPTVIPRVDLAAQICGGCHNGSHQPTYDEWSAGGHSAVVPEVLSSMSSSTNSIRSCGACHSGSARLALISGVDPAVKLAHDYNVPQTCAVCHDPHATNANPVQLYNPLSSTNNFQLTSADTASVGAFTNKYNANTNINLCAQCHNDRGAAWTTTSRAPHHSVQYNFLLGAAGVLLDGPATFHPGAHAGLPASADYSISGTFYLTNQCAACHMQDDTAGKANHSLAIATEEVCLNCHLTSPEILEEYYLTPQISNSVSVLITAMNRWAARQTNALLTATNLVAWEYTNPGGLTWQTNASGVVTSWSVENPVTFAGPGTSGQALIPDQVKKARFNMYLVLNDGSFGVHNPAMAINLLNAAQVWMTQVLQ